MLGCIVLGVRVWISPGRLRGRGAFDRACVEHFCRGLIAGVCGCSLAIMAEEYEEASPEQKVNIATYFIMSSPTGEVDDVIKGTLLVRLFEDAVTLVRLPRPMLMRCTQT